MYPEVSLRPEGVSFAQPSVHRISKLVYGLWEGSTECAGFAIGGP